MEKDNVSTATMYLSTIPNQHKSKTYIRAVKVLAMQAVS